MKLPEKIGMLKSRLIYDYKPFIQSRMRQFYSRFVKKDDLCFDIGAHTGNRSETWLNLGARVIAIEPQPRFARLISKKLGHYSDFTLLQSAVGSKQGKERLFISHKHPAISTLSESWKQVMQDFDTTIQYEENIEIEVITLDTLIERFGIPRFCKIDVEGYEENVLSGLSKPIPAVSFEFFPTTLKRAVTCIELLERFGKYKYNWSFIETFRFNTGAWLSADEMKQIILAYTGHKSGDIYAVNYY